MIVMMMVKFFENLKKMVMMQECCISRFSQFYEKSKNDRNLVLVAKIYLKIISCFHDERIFFYAFLVHFFCAVSSTFSGSGRRISPPCWILKISSILLNWFFCHIISFLWYFNLTLIKPYCACFLCLVKFFFIPKEIMLCAGQMCFSGSWTVACCSIFMSCSFAFQPTLGGFKLTLWILLTYSGKATRFFVHPLSWEVPAVGPHSAVPHQPASPQK